MSTSIHLQLGALVMVALLGLGGSVFPLAPAGAANEKLTADDPATRVQKLVAKQKEATEALRGTWERVEAKPAVRAEHQRWTFNGDTVTTETKLGANEIRKSKHRFQLNPLRDPPEITLHNEDGLIQGIYKLDGDALTIATCGISEVERPKGFTPETAGELVTKLVVLTFKRVLPKTDPAAEWTTRAVKALVSDDKDALPALAREFQKLPADARRALPLAIRADAVEFLFRGSMPVGENLAFVEFLIANEEKGYETLLVAPEDELKRLPALRPFFDRHARKDRRQWWDARLMWGEGDKPRSVDIGDVLGLMSAKERAEFLDGQEVEATGFFGGEETTGKNVKCDPAVLPQKPGPAVLQLTLRRAPQK